MSHIHLFILLCLDSALTATHMFRPTSLSTTGHGGGCWLVALGSLLLDWASAAGNAALLSFISLGPLNLGFEYPSSNNERRLHFLAIPS
ncbi:hypothetical protein FB45DRAFT_886471 [Roridomyces roridus]|uniref:Secreted protein n=1 Tax=Roridomyces roridus TaxID=1738132 RepID=A0AAD7G229_9AGAR|nr:hypothetical protein FB45DRAFT_886471 [Roridomyces roridus]